MMQSCRINAQSQDVTVKPVLGVSVKLTTCGGVRTETPALGRFASLFPEGGCA